jgi:hypothetical protein
MDSEATRVGRVSPYVRPIGHKDPAPSSRDKGVYAWGLEGNILTGRRVGPA